MPFRIPRCIPNDYRHFNYKISETAFSTSLPTTNAVATPNWILINQAANHIQNLTQDIKILAQMDMLDSIPKLTKEVKAKILEFLS